MIPVFKPSYDSEELNALEKTLKSGWVGLGPVTAEFEKAFAQYIGVPYAVGTNSCTASLHLALSMLNLEGAEVITTPMTFVSTNHAILYNKAKPVFADIEPDTLNIDLRQVESLITPKTKAIMLVHYGGHACDIDGYKELARKHKLHLIEDVAHGCGGEYKGKKLGSFGDLNCFSFHAVKNLATGEGGMITMKEAAWDTALRKRRWMGISKDTWKRTEITKSYSWFYTVEEVGYKYHMSDIQATLGLVQLKKLDRLNDRRRTLGLRYTEALRALSWIETPIEKPYAKRSWHNYVIRVKNGKRDELMQSLQEKGISTSVHYFPNHLYDLYKPYTRSLPVAEEAWKEIVTLPLFPDLTEAQVDEIVEQIKVFGKKL